MDIEEIIERDEFSLIEFKFEKGDIIRGAKIEYGTFGTPIYDEKGHITNAIVYLHGSGGNYGSVKRINEITGPGDVIDTDKFFIISLSALGTPNTISPSTTALNNNFPEYTITDMVNIQKQFLEVKYKIKHVKGIIGNSMGGFEALKWATLYSDFMDFTIALATSYKNAGHNYTLSKLEKDIIESDPDFKKGEIGDSMKRSLKILSEAIYHFGQTKAYYRELSNKEIEEEMNEFATESTEENPYDLLYRNKAIIDYDIEKELKKIKSKLLIISINNDEYFPPELDGIPLHNIVKNSKLLILDSIHGHLGSSELTPIKNDIEEFIKEFK